MYVYGKRTFGTRFETGRSGSSAMYLSWGMMNMITTDLMDACGVTWPEAHTDAQMMADLALASYQHGCFENVGVPFCMTIEAEELGAKVTLGSKILNHM